MCLMVMWVWAWVCVSWLCEADACLVLEHCWCCVVRQGTLCITPGVQNSTWWMSEAFITAPHTSAYLRGQGQGQGLRLRLRLRLRKDMGIGMGKTMAKADNAEARAKHTTKAMVKAKADHDDAEGIKPSLRV